MNHRPGLQEARTARRARRCRSGYVLRSTRTRNQAGQHRVRPSREDGRSTRADFGVRRSSTCWSAVTRSRTQASEGTGKTGPSRPCKAASSRPSWLTRLSATASCAPSASLLPPWPVAMNSRIRSSRRRASPSSACFARRNSATSPDRRATSAATRSRAYRTTPGSRSRARRAARKTRSTSERDTVKRLSQRRRRAAGQP